MAEVGWVPVCDGSSPDGCAVAFHRLAGSLFEVSAENAVPVTLEADPSSDVVGWLADGSVCHLLELCPARVNSSATRAVHSRALVELGVWVRAREPSQRCSHNPDPNTLRLSGNIGDHEVS
jgi:hypothetical protein